MQGALLDAWRKGGQEDAKMIQRRACPWGAGTMTEEITMQQGPGCTDKIQLGFVTADLTLRARLLVRAESVTPLSLRSSRGTCLSE